MTEADLQKFTIDLLRKCASPGVIYFHCPNGAPTSAITGARMKAMGLLAGVADMVIVRPAGLVYFLELKTPKGRLSPGQRAFRDTCRDSIVPYAVATTPAEVEAILSSWGALRSIAAVPARMQKAA